MGQSNIFINVLNYLYVLSYFYSNVKKNHLPIHSLKYPCVHPDKYLQFIFLPDYSFLWIYTVRVGRFTLPFLRPFNSPLHTVQNNNQGFQD